MQLVDIMIQFFWQSLMILLVVASFVTNDLILVGLAAGCEIIALIFLAIVTENANNSQESKYDQKEKY